MTSRRMIHPSFWRSENISKLTKDQRLLFLGLISNADDQGRLRAHPSLIRSDVYPFEDEPLDKIIADLSTIAETGSLSLYEITDTQYIQITGWWKYQRPKWAWPSELPPPPDWIDRTRYRAGNEIIKANWDGDGGFSEPDESEQAHNSQPNHSDTAVESSRDDSDTIVIPAPSTSTSDSDSNSDSSKDSAPSAGATAPKPPPTPKKQSSKPKKLPLTPGAQEFLRLFSAKRFANTAQRNAVLALESEFPDHFVAATTWAAERGMSRGQAIAAIRSALPNWGKAKPKPKTDAAKMTGPDKWLAARQAAGMG